VAARGQPLGNGTEWSAPAIERNVIVKSSMIVAAAIALAASTLSAQASCGDYTILKSGKQTVKMPALPRQNVHPDGGASIVGMWEVAYTAGGNPVYQALEQWHSDGLEWEFADIPTFSGDVCMGVWSGQGKKVSLYHTGWTFDSNGLPNGTMVLTHADKVAKDGNTFSGTFDLKFFDADGNLLNEVMGDDNGTRIPAP
jgi:hypothetical protein